MNYVADAFGEGTKENPVNSFYFFNVWGKGGWQDSVGYMGVGEGKAWSNTFEERKTNTQQNTGLQGT